jgi:hypothetical protein
MYIHIYLQIYIYLHICIYIHTYIYTYNLTQGMDTDPENIPLGENVELEVLLISHMKALSFLYLCIYL